MVTITLFASTLHEEAVEGAVSAVEALRREYGIRVYLNVIDPILHGMYSDGPLAEIGGGLFSLPCSREEVKEAVIDKVLSVLFRRGNGEAGEVFYATGLGEVAA